MQQTARSTAHRTSAAGRSGAAVTSAAPHAQPEARQFILAASKAVTSPETVTRSPSATSSSLKRVISPSSSVPLPVPDDGGTKNENPSLGLELLFGRLPPWKLPRIVIGMRERPTWIIMKKKPSFSFVDVDADTSKPEEEEEEEEEVDEEDVVRHSHRAFTVVDILHPYYYRNSRADVDSDDYEHEHERAHDHGAAAAPEGSYVPHIAAFESKAFAHWVRVAISADPSWKEARLRRVSLTRLVEACDTVRIPRVVLFRTSFLRGITCHKL